MAITINQPLESFQPVYNDAFYIVSSTNVAQPNFKFYCEIYINGVSVDIKKITPEPINDKGIVYVNRIAESFLTYDFDYLATAAVTPAINSTCEIYIEFGEEYGATPTVYPALTTSAITRFWNGARPFIQSQIFGNNYYICTNPLSLGLSSKNSETFGGDNRFNLYHNQYDFLYFVHTNQVVKLYINTTDNVGVVANYIIDVSAATANAMNYVPIGYNVNNLLIGDFLLGAPPVYDSTIVSAEIYLADIIGTALTETYYLTLKESCTSYQEYDVYYQDNLGGFDSIRFTKPTKEEINVTRSEYKKSIYKMTPGGSYGVDAPARSATNFFTEAEDVWTLRTDWMDDNDVRMMAHLFASPIVIIVLQNEIPFHIQIIGASFEKRKTIQGELIQYELQVKFANTNPIQRY